MKSRLYPIRVVGMCIAVAAAVNAEAQPGKATAAGAAAWAADFESALALARKGNHAAAEATLVAHSRAHPNTMEADVDTATRMIQLALVLRESYDYKNANALAQRAALLLNDSLSKRGPVSTAKQKSRAYETVGLLHERLFGDLVAATDAYQQAQKHDPASPVAGAGLIRLKQAEEMKKRSGGRG